MGTNQVILLVLLYSLTVSYCQIAVSPVNQASIVSTTVTLNCQIPTVGDPTVQWNQFADATADPTIVSFGETIPNQDSFGNFSVISETSGGNTIFNLQINPLQMNYGARYDCVNARDSSRAQAYLVVLEADPTCSANTSLSDLMEGETVKLTCSVRYSVKGNSQEQAAFSPVMAWSGPGVPPAEDESTAGSKSQYSVTIPLDPETNGDTFSCVTSFETPENLPPLSATNAPSYTNSWTSAPFNVQYGPRNAIADPTGPGLSPDTEITCTATGNPNPTFEWVNLADNTTTKGNKFLVPGYNEGGINEFRIVCRASNEIRGQTYTIETNPIIFDVVTTTTTTTTTTPIPTTIPSTTAEPAARVEEPTEPGEEAAVLGAGVIAGIAIGALIFLGLILFLIYFCYVRRKRADKEKAANDTRPPPNRDATNPKYPAGYGVDQVRHPSQNSFDSLEHPPKPGGGYPVPVGGYPGGEEPPPYNNSPYSSMNNSMSRDVPYHPDPTYDDPRNRNAENLQYADLALDDTPRSRKPIQLYDTVGTDYAEIKRV